jgi:hypothetical protein
LLTKRYSMKTWFLWFILLIFLLAGCYPSETISPTNSISIPTQTHQPSPTPSPTPTIQPTIALTSTVTLTPDTPLSECPSGNLELKPDFTQQLSAEFPHLGESILAFLNSGGTPQAVIQALSWTEQQGLSPDWAYDSSIKNKSAFNESHLFEKDLTSDGIPEFVVSRINLYIFGCRNEKYEILLELENDDFLNRVAAPWIIAIDDLNSDGLPEIVVKSYYGRLGETAFRIFEWRSENFQSLLVFEPASKYFLKSDIFEISVGDLILDDLDKNGTKEVIIRGYELLTDGLPTRGEQYTFKWNEINFVFSSKEYSKPVYRFEAVQDGDRYSKVGNYDKAISFYQDAIFSNKLDWWSSERNRYEVNCFGSKPNCPYFPTPPSPDPKEYFNLAAYSRFRLMLIYILRGWQPDAEVVYNELQKQFQSGQTGYAYAEMANKFWVEYQQSKSMVQACSKAIEYAESNTAEILSYLGNGDYALAYYGEQSLRYTAQDVCPFK